MSYSSLERLLAEVAEMVAPHSGQTVAEAAEEHRYIYQPGSYSGPYRNDLTPYNVEFQETLTSYDYDAAVFVGSAQAGKTEPLNNWITYTAKIDPADMMIVEKSRTAARDFSMRRLDRLFRYTKAVADEIAPGTQAKNTFDVRFRSGMILSLSWPTINELSGKPIPRIWLTDYDRFPLDIGGEGTAFYLASTRTISFGRNGMTVAESTPSHPIKDPSWEPKNEHEMPPADGIASLYNAGDRRRYFWKCFSCSTPFLPSLDLFRIPDSEDFVEAGEAATMACPHCNAQYTHDGYSSGLPGKHELNLAGKWVRQGNVWLPDGKIVGTPRRSKIGSFKLNGFQAAFQDWSKIITKYLTAKQVLDETGSEEDLKVTINVDQGESYLPKAMQRERLPEDLKTRAGTLGERVVPPAVRFLVATVDSQKNMFVVQVQGIAFKPGYIQADTYLIDRFEIRKSERLDEDDERLWVKPGIYAQDWHLIVDQVILKTYPLDDTSGRHMNIKMTAIDSGGNEAMTANAYEFYRYLKSDEDGRQLHKRVQLVKGASVRTAPRVQISYPDAERKDQRAQARGEIPVLMINTEMLKDEVSAMLDIEETGSGRIFFANWLPNNIYAELTAETKTPKGWQKAPKARNEAFDLLVYTKALCLSSHIRLDRMDFSDPPGWAEEWDNNDLISEKVEGTAFVNTEKDSYDVLSLAEQLA